MKIFNSYCSHSYQPQHSSGCLGVLYDLDISKG